MKVATVTIRTELDGDVFAWKLDSTNDPELRQICEACDAEVMVWWEVEEFPTPDWTPGGTCYCGTCASGMIADVNSADVLLPVESGEVCEGWAIFGFGCEETSDVLLTGGLDLEDELPIMDLSVCSFALKKLLDLADENRWNPAPLSKAMTVEPATVEELLEGLI